MNLHHIKYVLFFTCTLLVDGASLRSGANNNLSGLNEYIGYYSLTQFLNEPDETTTTKQKVAQSLERNNLLLDVTPSQGLLLAQGNLIKPYLRNLIKTTPQLTQAFDAMLATEKHICSRGNHTIYHGCKKEYYATMYLHSKLHELFHGKKPNFLHLRQPTPIYTPQKDPMVIRTSLLQNGGGWLGIQDRYHMLFGNIALSANLYGNGLYNESALLFFIQEPPIFTYWKQTVTFFKEMFTGKSNAIDLHMLFEQYNLGAWYNKHKSKIIKVLTSDLSHNVMLQFELSPELLSATSYPCKPGGAKTAVKINDETIKDPTIICDTLCKKPCAINDPHLIIWTMILTHDLLLNPDAPEMQNGFKVHVHSMEPEKLNALQTRINNLVATIETHV